MNIALIEDSPDWHLLIQKQLLKYNDFSVVLQCSWGDDFFNLYQSVHIDLILLDINLPGTDGFTLFQQIREVLPNTPVVVFTSSNNNYDISRFANTDILKYINKCRLKNLNEDLKVVMNLKKKMGYSFHALGDDQTKLLQYICCKLTNEEIAQRLNIEPKTLENRINKLCDSLGIERKKICVYEFSVQYGFWNPWAQ